MSAVERPLDEYIKPQEEVVERDIERVREYQILYPQYTYLEPRTVQISTGLILAYRFADKVRRALFAVFGNALPREAILASAAEINKRIYEILTERGIGKTDVIKIVFKARHEPDKRMVTAEEIQVIRYLPEEKMQQCLEVLKNVAEIAKKALGEHK